MTEKKHSPMTIETLKRALAHDSYDGVNAEHIVRCVNAHDGLVAALKLARSPLLDTTVLLAIDAALAKAGAL